MGSAVLLDGSRLKSYILQAFTTIYILIVINITQGLRPVMKNYHQALGKRSMKMSRCDDCQSISVMVEMFICSKNRPTCNRLEK